MDSPDCIVRCRVYVRGTRGRATRNARPQARDSNWCDNGKQTGGKGLDFFTQSSTIEQPKGYRSPSCKANLRHGVVARRAGRGPRVYLGVYPRWVVVGDCLVRERGGVARAPAKSFSEQIRAPRQSGLDCVRVGEHGEQRVGYRACHRAHKHALQSARISERKRPRGESLTRQRTGRGAAPDER